MAPANDGGNFAIQRPSLRLPKRNEMSLQRCSVAAPHTPRRRSPAAIACHGKRDPFLLTVRAAHESLTILALFPVEKLRFETHSGIAEIVFDIERNKSENCSPHRAPCCTPRP